MAAQPLATKILYGARKRKGPQKLLLWPRMRLSSATASLATILRDQFPVAIFGHSHLEAFPPESAQQPMLAQIACLLSFPAKSELVGTFPAAVAIDLIEVMGYNLCAVRGCATVDGSLKREEHRSSHKLSPCSGWVGKPKQLCYTSNSSRSQGSDGAVGPDGIAFHDHLGPEDVTDTTLTRS